MVLVSDRALERLHRALSVSTDTSSRCFRVRRQRGTGLVLKFARPQPEDTTFEVGGRTVLALPRELEHRCAGEKMEVTGAGEIRLA